MTSPDKRVFVISDLHLGGTWPDIDKGDRGFRMMTQPKVLAAFIRALTTKATGSHQTELVINGDFIDFLAENHDGEERWLPFVEDQAEAVATFNRIAEREGDCEVFDALAKFLEHGRTLTVLLGNHDIELSLPAVRQAMERRLGISTRTAYRFLYDGEAYEIGNALIEHGNRYDPANVVNHDELRKVRSLLSRRQFEYVSGWFEPLAGSRLVSELINPIKSEYSFIDLLKPESEPLFALLLALEPGYRETMSKLAKVVRAVPDMLRHRPAKPALPSVPGDIGATMSSLEHPFAGDMASRLSHDDDDLSAVLQQALPADAVANILAISDEEEQSGDIGARSDFLAKLGLARLLASGDFASVDERLEMIQQTLWALDGDRSFDTKYETGKRYFEAAEELSKHYSFVVFGHTHHAKEVLLPSGATYFNTGTWINLMRFPNELFNPDKPAALEALKLFFADLRENRLEKYIEFIPTYLRLDVTGTGGKEYVTKAKLQVYEGETLL